MGNKNYLLALSAIIFIISLAMFAENEYGARYPGLFYFEPTLLALALFILMLRIGLTLQFGEISHLHSLRFLREINVYAFIVVLLLFSTSAVQYTPFSPIDKKILNLEHYLHFDLQSVVAWTNTHWFPKTIANAVYYSFSYQVIMVPIFVMLARKYELLYEYYFLVLFTWLMGACIYYFFPTAGPASVFTSPYFDGIQRLTGLKFWQLHHYIQPASSDGGMIAMPSFHVIWAWLCVYLMRPWPILFSLILVLNSLVVASCVLLGWHYLLDVVGSLLTLLTAHGVYYLCHLQRSGTPSLTHLSET